MNHTPCSTSDPCCNHPYPASPMYLPSASGLLLLAPRLLSATVYSAVDVVKRTFDGTLEDDCLSKPCCDIPETLCPSPYVCRVHWTGCPGDSFKYQIQVTNTSKVDREFTLTSVPFPCTEEAVKVTPDKKTLGPDESVMAVVSFTIPDTFTTFGGSTYRTRITVAGKYEQYIEVCLTVRPQQACSCHIEQGEIPKRIKAKHWYHHFQCEEDCFPPAGKGVQP